MVQAQDWIDKSETLFGKRTVNGMPEWVREVGDPRLTFRRGSEDFIYIDGSKQVNWYFAPGWVTFFLHQHNPSELTILRRRLSRPQHINPKGKGGAITFRAYSDGDLEVLKELLIARLGQDTSTTLAKPQQETELARNALTVSDGHEEDVTAPPSLETDPESRLHLSSSGPAVQTAPATAEANEVHRTDESGLELQSDDVLSTELTSIDWEAVEDERKRISSLIVQRQGQRMFREQLLKAYGGECAVTGTNADDALEAAHIVPYRGPSSNTVQNGLLLRSDIHTLFDLGLIAIDSDTMTVCIAPRLRNTSYGRYRGTKLLLPEDQSLWPSRSTLDLHRQKSHVD